MDHNHSQIYVQNVDDKIKNKTLKYFKKRCERIISLDLGKYALKMCARLCLGKPNVTERSIRFSHPEFSHSYSR